MRLTFNLIEYCTERNEAVTSTIGDRVRVKHVVEQPKLSTTADETEELPRVYDADDPTTVKLLSFAPLPFLLWRAKTRDALRAHLVALKTSLCGGCDRPHLTYAIAEA